MHGYDYRNPQSERSVHHVWAKKLMTEFGFRIGTFDCDGVRSFYVFKTGAEA